MSDSLEPRDIYGPPWQPHPEVILATLAPEPPPQQPKRKWKLPLALFLATCASVLLMGGWVYAICLMTILVCHEAGHFIQARRYGVFATYPFFLPLPIPPIGTLGAVIAMDPRIKDRKALFDIGITGPLAGLVPTLIFCVLGIFYDAKLGLKPPPDLAGFEFGEPLLLKGLVYLRFGSIPEGSEVFIGPMSMAGWVGLLITALNLIPIGQLDGGHILYALLRRRAHAIAVLLLMLSAAAVVWGIVVHRQATWALMVVLLAMMGPRHPPTANDNVDLGIGRIVLGWLTLAFLVVGFTPNPLPMH